jgi:hypothetical protein
MAQRAAKLLPDNLIDTDEELNNLATEEYRRALFEIEPAHMKKLSRKLSQPIFSSNGRKTLSNFNARRGFLVRL